MNLTVSNADVQELAARLDAAINEAYQKGRQAERERICARYKLAEDMLDMLKVCHSALEYVGPWETPVGLIERVEELIQKVEGNDEN